MILELKNTGRARVIQTLDGRVSKYFNGPKAGKRFENECRVLQHLNQLECPFVPRLLDVNTSRLSITTEYCGRSVGQLCEKLIKSLFERLEEYSVQHNDPALRNLLYDPRRHDFTVIDFELAEISHHKVSVVQNPDVLRVVLAEYSKDILSS